MEYNIEATKLNDQAGALLHHGWRENADQLGAFYSDVIRPDLCLTVRLNIETHNWHVQLYCAATKGFIDFQFTTPQRAFEFGHTSRWSIASRATAV